MKHPKSPLRMLADLVMRCGAAPDAQRCSIAPEHQHRAPDEVYLGLPREIRCLGFEASRVRKIVAIHARHQLTPCMLRYLVEPSRNASAPSVVKNLDPLVVACHLRADLGGPIRRPVVRNDQLPADMRLPLN
jgi:hypothetical protein